MSETSCFRRAVPAGLRHSGCHLLRVPVPPGGDRYQCGARLADGRGRPGRCCGRRTGMTPMPPASMSKLMTLELLFQRLKDGRDQADRHAARFPNAPGAPRAPRCSWNCIRSIPVEALIRGIIIDSGNDACVVVAEGLGGTVEGFVDMMNKRAKELGLAQSTFRQPGRTARSAGPDDERAGPCETVAPPDQRLSELLPLFQREGIHLAQYHPAEPRSGAGHPCPVRTA